MSTPTSITPTYETLSRLPSVDIPANVRAALAKGQRATAIAAEATALRFGPGRLSPQEYVLCRYPHKKNSRVSVNANWYKSNRAERIRAAKLSNRPGPPQFRER